MDPIESTVPEEGALEIKKRIRERDGSDEEGRPFKRARSDTTTLLPLESDDNSPMQNDAPPKPEDNLEDYGNVRLSSGLQYVDKASKKRNITPRTKEFLRLHKEAYKLALESPNEREKSCAVVQALDKVYYSSAFYFHPRDQKEHDRLMAYVKLRRWEMLANYGDYLGQSMQNFRAELKESAKTAPEVKTASLELGPSKTWLEIADELKGQDVNNLRQHVYVASDALGVDPKHMIWLIEEWGERNRIFHCQIRDFIKACHWRQLADQLCRDLKELPNIAPDEDTAKMYEQVLLELQSEYFKVLDANDPEFWFPNDNALALSTKVTDQKKKQKS